VGAPYSRSDDAQTGQPCNPNARLRVLVFTVYISRYELSLAISIGIFVWAVLDLAIYLRREHASS
jgi:hypothetical protein